MCSEIKRRQDLIGEGEPFNNRNLKCCVVNSEITRRQDLIGKGEALIHRQIHENLLSL